MYLHLLSDICYSGRQNTRQKSFSTKILFQHFFNLFCFYFNENAHRSASRPVVTESYSIVAIFDCVACHPLVDILTALNCSGYNNCAATKVNLKRSKIGSTTRQQHILNKAGLNGNIHSISNSVKIHKQSTSEVN